MIYQFNQYFTSSIFMRKIALVLPFLSFLCCSVTQWNWNKINNLLNGWLVGRLVGWWMQSFHEQYVMMWQPVCLFYVWVYCFCMLHVVFYFIFNPATEKKEEIPLILYYSCVWSFIPFLYFLPYVPNTFYNIMSSHSLVLKVF